ncbi:MAG: hypothetical protein J5819_00225 [Eubacterium sp.]|nr:hypothetical protein [Eubacterium sp.]
MAKNGTNAGKEVKTEEVVAEEVRTEEVKNVVEPKKPAEKPEFTQQIYIGPSIKGYIKANEIRTNGFSDSEINRITSNFSKSDKLFRKLIVPIEELGKAMLELRKPDSYLALIYEEFNNIIYK